MASGGLSVVTPPRISEKSSPSYAIDGKYKTSKTHQSSHRVSHSTQSKTRFNESQKLCVSQTETQQKSEPVSTQTHQQTQQQHYKRSYSVSYYKSHDSQTRKRSDSNYKKRRYSFGTNNDSKYKKRRKDGIVLPTKFLMGGNINDPLNLLSLTNDVNQVTPQSSPLPLPKHRTQVEVLIPANINDPLNLNSNEDIDELSLISPKAKGKSRKRKRRRTDSETTADGEVEGINTSDNKLIDIELKKPVENAVKPQKLRFNETIKIVDKIVSPVIPQGVSCSKHRRFVSDPQKASTEIEISLHKEPKIKNKKYKKNKSKPNETHFRAKDSNFRYGNYNRYYGYRNRHQTDQRLECFKKDWFENKDVLDIGCNAGHITLAIARDFHPNKIIGLDIDKALIKTARKNVRHYITNNVMEKEDFPISLPLFHGPLASTALVTNNEDESESKPSFPNNVFFVETNYVLESDDLLSVQKREFDCILCLSLTKWIHLNWGDIGLKRVFKRMFTQLKPGGKLVLEAQPWCSYKKKKSINETTLNNFNSIKFRPEQFNEYLLSREVGFSQSEMIGTPAHPSKGFRRPIYLFTKSGVNSDKE